MSPPPLVPLGCLPQFSSDPLSQRLRRQHLGLGAPAQHPAGDLLEVGEFEPDLDRLGRAIALEYLDLLARVPSALGCGRAGWS